MTYFLTKNVKTIYNHIQNEYSRKMFINRLLYSLTDDNQYILNIINMTQEGKEFISKLNNNKKKIIFGAGTWGKIILETYTNVKFDCFVDNKPKAPEFNGLPVITFDEYLKHYKNDMIIISSRLYYRELYNQLKNHGIDDSLIINAGKMIDDMSKRQYFDLPELKENQLEKEIFVDAGSFDGTTSLLFLDWCGDKIGKVFAFEPEEKNAGLCKANLEEKFRTIQKVSGGGYAIVRSGLWNQKDVLHFQSGASGASMVSEEGDICINVDCLDNMLNDEPVTFIKMDLEGSEYNALLGAEKTIAKYKPKLAISVYHKPEDIWELPGLILSMNPDYKFWFGHYSTAAAETVLYAI